jgi:hypothetical protein
MARSFDETNDYISIADDARLTFPAQASTVGWTWGCWVKLADNVGTSYQYFASWGNFNAFPSFNFYFGEASATASGDRGKLIARVNDSDSSSVSITSSTTPGTSTDWQHVMLVTEEFVTTIYVNGVSVGTDNPANELSEINLSSAFELGRRSDANAARYFGGKIAEVFKVNRVVTATEIAAMQLSPASRVLAADATDNGSWFAPLRGDHVDELRGNLAVTNNGSTNANDHPPIAYTRRRSGLIVPAAGGGGSILPHMMQLAG